MPAPVDQIVEDLAGQFRGDLRCDAITRSLYATDGSLHEIVPLGVAAPRDADDVVTLARYAAEHRLPLIPRGAGTSVAGEALGAGLIIDFSRYMNAFELIAPDQVRVQPGVVHERLNTVLRKLGRYFAPDPSGSPVTTMGSMLALDAAGAHSISIGSTRDYVRSIEAVLATGERLEFGPVMQHAGVATNGDARVSSLAEGVREILQPHTELIRERQPPTLFRNRAGYWLRNVVTPTQVDLPRLLVGSEGTLACFTAATLQILPLPPYRGLLVAVFSSLDGAARSVRAVQRATPTACDLIDRRLLSLARETDPRFEAILPADAEAALLIEQTAATPQQLQQRLNDTELALRSDSPSTAEDPGTIVVKTIDAEEVERFWSLASRVVPLLNGLAGQTRPLPFVEDLAVPPHALEELLLRVQRILQKHEVVASLYAHAAAGQVHLRPFIAQRSPHPTALLEALLTELCDAALSLGGTISGEHGLGLSRSGLLSRQYGPLMPVFRQIKNLFDPDGLLNPGKVLSHDTHLSTRHLRAEIPVRTPSIGLQLQWSPTQLVGEVASCNGCGDCRTQVDGLRMCPFFRNGTAEQAAPRSKANALRQVLTSSDWTAFSSPVLREVASLCFNCKQCHRECAAQVDIPHLVTEMRAQIVGTEGLSRASFLLSRLFRAAPWGSRLASFSNALLRSPSFRWVLERIARLSRHRKVPAYAPRNAFQMAESRWLAPPKGRGPQPPVVLFLDTDATWHHPENAIAASRLLELLGLEVHWPRRQTAAGMDMVNIGDVDGARGVARTNIRALADLAREGSPVLCIEPTSAVCLKHEYPLIVDDPDALVVAEQVHDAGSYIVQRLGESGLTPTSIPPVHAAYHLPCHLRYLEGKSTLAESLSRLPGVRLQDAAAGCSGMAGQFGLDSKTFEHSLQLGQRLKDRLQNLGESLNVSECANCRMQMEQYSGRGSIHPLRLLAAGYGAWPEDRPWEPRPIHERTVT